MAANMKTRKKIQEVTCKQLKIEKNIEIAFRTYRATQIQVLKLGK